ncbi:zinc metalloproteinase nas-7-like [Tachypleus tridentatus]|uniref:zinc metalloproteinase nas-7-like n=1 Tax=Tachypleus tridentatus TaxID=6853 RepID=UPI003FD24582
MFLSSALLSYLCLSFSSVQSFSSQAERRHKRHAVSQPEKLWPNATVPYFLDVKYSNWQRNKLVSSMKKIEDVSCVKFVPKTNEKVFLNIIKGKGCKAHIGYTGKPVKTTLGKNCFTSPRIIHELMHVLGFIHEHNRPDRDNYIIINFPNIPKSMRHNFWKSDPHKVTTLNLSYDYQSILHYRPQAFAIDKSMKSILPVGNQTIKIGMGRTLSELDVEKVNKLYQCSDPNEDWPLMEEHEGLDNTDGTEENND